MRHIYNGNCYNRIKCSNYDEVIDAIKSGEWFRTDSMDWHYISVPFEVSRNTSVPGNVFLLRRVNVTSVTTKFTYFYTIEKDETTSSKIYVGKALEDKICDEVKMWVKNINPKTLKAFGGHDFTSYLNAIPQEVFLRDGFADRLKKVLVSGFVERIKKETTEEGIDRISTISAITKKIVDANLNKSVADNQETNEKTNKKLEALRQKRIEEMCKEK